MPVLVAKHSGYCAGVRKAMDQALEAAEAAREAGLRVYSLGSLIHNPLALKQLRDAGITAVDSLDEVPPGQAVILRSHGVAPEVLEQCAARGLKPVDCTCDYVKALHERVRHAAEAGIPVILVGERAHPEVRATAAWYRPGAGAQGPGCLVVENAEEAAALEEMDSALVVSQTTFPETEWDEVLRVLSGRVKHLTERKTICNATARRLQEAVDIARRCDCVIVFGGLESANTRRLYEACLRECPRTCLVECEADIPQHFYDIHKDFIGVTAGASTPDRLLKEVVAHMDELEKKVPVEENAPVEQVAPEVETAPAEEAAPAQEGKPAEEVSEEEQGNQDFQAALDKSLVRIRNGQTLVGRVVQVNDDEIGVSIGYKSDGILKREDLVDKDVKVGDEIEVEVVKVNDGEGNVLLSQRNIVNRKVWEDLMEKYRNGEYIEAVGKEAVKGGLICSVEGVRAFVPASRLALNYVDKIAQFVGQTLRLKIIDVDEQKKRIVASRKDVLIEESAARKAEAWARLEEGAVVTGIVRRFASFGAFVDLGGVDGLIHVTDMSWGRVNHPSDVLKINQEVQLKILSLDREKERIQLGYKQLQPRPWDNVEEKYPIGCVLERPVVRIREFGAFIELEPGVDGLVHISQCAQTRVGKVEEVLSVGQIVRVKVLNVDPEAKRISLSIRAVLDDEAAMAQPEEYGEAPEAPVEE